MVLFGLLQMTLVFDNIQLGAMIDFPICHNSNVETTRLAVVVVTCLEYTRARWVTMQ
jgi:hypothetical protein